MLTNKEIEILKLRKANLTQVDVARKIGISQAAVSSFEKNAFRKIEDAKKVEELVRKLKIDYFLK